jgi:hypothetical protein
MYNEKSHSLWESDGQLYMLPWQQSPVQQKLHVWCNQAGDNTIVLL